MEVFSPPALSGGARLGTCPEEAPPASAATFRMSHVAATLCIIFSRITFLGGLCFFCYVTCSRRRGWSRLCLRSKKRVVRERTPGPSCPQPPAGGLGRWSCWSGQSTLRFHGRHLSKLAERHLETLFIKVTLLSHVRSWSHVCGFCRYVLPKSWQTLRPIDF